MIQRLYVDNFRCLANFEFRPDRVNLILGKNGSGKSTLLEALKCLAGVLGGVSPQSIFTRDTLPWWDVRRAQTLELDLVDPGSEAIFAYRIVVQHSSQESPKVIEERLRLGDQTLLSLEAGAFQLAGVEKAIPFDGTQSVLSLGLGRDPALARFRSSAVNLLVFRLNPWALDPIAQVEQRMLTVDGANLVAYLRYWSQSAPEAYVAWRRRVLDGMPHIEDLKLLELAPGSRMLAGVKRVEGGERFLSLGNFSEGERALLALHAIVGLKSSDQTIAMDEPDNFLSPSEVQPVLRAFTLEGPSPPSGQLLVVTHHPESIDYLAAYATWLFEREPDGLTRVRRLKFNRENGERPTDAVLAELSA